MSGNRLLAELKRRNVLHAAAFYAASAWLLVQVATQVFPFFGIPGWVVRWIVVASLIGFPIAMLASWFYAWTPHGIQRESGIDAGESVGHAGGKVFDRWIIAILVLAVALLLADRWVLHRDVGAVAGKSIAVLPFENRSEDRANAYFASGIQDEILTRLARIGALKVISRTSTQQYASSPDNLPRIARELGVANVLEGSVQRVGDRVRINVQLIRADDDTHLWAETYDRKLTDIFGVESEVAAAIADSLRATLTGTEQRALAVRPTENVAAYEAYLRGLALEAAGNSNDEYIGAAAAFADAVRLDPRFALAWAHLAGRRSLLYFNGIDATQNTPGAIRRAADMALKLRPALGEAWLAQGNYQYRVRRDFPGALRDFEEARKRLPNSAQTLASIALVQRRVGQWNQALTTMQQAVERDPRNVSLLDTQAHDFLLPVRRFADARAVIDRALLIAPGSMQLIAAKANIYQAEGRLDEAARLLDPLSLDPANEDVFGAKVSLLWAQGHFDEAVSAARMQMPAADQPLDYAQTGLAVSIGYAERRLGREAQARSQFERVIGTLKPTPATGVRVDNTGLPMTLALAYAGIGNKEAALEEARRAVDLYADDALQKPQAEIALAQIRAMFGDADVAIAALPYLLQVPNGVKRIDLQVDPPWDPLRRDPRFQALLKPSGRSGTQGHRPGS